MSGEDVFRSEDREKGIPGPVLLWFRLDLRLADNPALREAVEAGSAVIPVFVYAPEEDGRWAPGAVSRWWLHRSLEQLDARLRQLGSKLVLRRGPTAEALCELARRTGARLAVWSRRYEPHVIRRDAEVRSALLNEGVRVRQTGGALLVEPWQLRSAAGRPFRVFTPFWTALEKRIREAGKPLAVPQRIPPPETWPGSLRLEDLALLPTREQARSWEQRWQPGETGAQAALRRFVQSGLRRYRLDRDRLDRPGTSALSPHLHFGEISPRQVWHSVAGKAALPRSANAVAFLRELAWREFAHHVLYFFPEAVEEPLKPQFRNFPWRDDAELLRAWQQGQTGYPIVDAGMRELSQTGWIPNRVRMIVASFLVKHLGIRWQAGAEWFWRTLADADLASNTLNWQWVAGCGVDAAPYFRVFNPVLQGEKFDPQGDYVRRWVPELERLPDEWIHRPWEAPPNVLTAAGVELGKTYPRPLVDHKQARDKLLAAFNALRRSGDAVE